MRRALIAVAILAVIGGAVVVATRTGVASACGAGFTAEGPRCRARGSCPAPLEPTPRGCDAKPIDRVDVPATKVLIGPSDWEAEGRITPRMLDVTAFAIDRLEVTDGLVCSLRRTHCTDDPGRATAGVGLAEARALCKERGGRLPTEDEWLAAAAGDKPRRYPWGDTGAVCRRAAWGIEHGPCAEGADGPDTAGAHPDGASPLGIHDLAGNVAEWVEASVPVVRGGSWRTSLATQLRTWPRTEVSAEVAANGAATIGFRCAYGGVR